ncbi:MAG: hypothetical protein FMNOHCHN_03602 [Ignavibacteriaceae bacterium]|nr:hypothetical protein [Ignavibacteriaceae bacterium]GIL17944.1 MAG: hypothetical protein BroJett040_16950 [Oligoflexia bacterium]
MRGLFSIITCSLILTACNYNDIKDPNAFGRSSNDKMTSPVSGQTTLSWNLIKTNVLRTCTTCHAGRTAPELGNLASVRQSINASQSSINSNAMPPSQSGYSALTDCEKGILDMWVRQGMPETSTATVSEVSACADQAPGSGQTPEPPLEEMPLTYQTVYSRILQPQCVRCHNIDDTTSAAGILFYPYEELMKKEKLWRAPGASSKLVKSLRRMDDKRMPPLKDGPGLTEKEIQFVIRWIDAGKPK